MSDPADPPVVRSGAGRAAGTSRGWLRLAAPRRAIVAPRLATVAAAVAAAIAATIALAGCGVGASHDSLPPEVTAPIPSIPPAVADTRRLVVDALAHDGLTLQDATQPFRPPESPSMADAARGIFQVVLPDDPNHGYLVIYAFRDAATAATAAADQAAYIGSGPGRVQFPPDTQSVIRQVDTTVIVYSWSPANSTDAHAASIATDLATIGLEVPIPQ